MRVKLVGKKMVALFLAVIVAAGTIGIGGLDLKAGAVNHYSASAAVNYAKTYVNYYNGNYTSYKGKGGDCANFVSQCLYAGGLESDSTWKPDSYAWINVWGLYSYLTSKNYTVKYSASDAEVGDVVIYANSSATYGHATICVENGSKVASHTSDGIFNITYMTLTCVIKMNGFTPIQVPEGVYVFHCVRNPDRVLDIQYDSKERGANIQLYNNWYNQVQKFRVVNMGDYYCIQSVYSGMWLDISYPYDEDGCNIQLWDTNTSTEQKWVFEDAGNGNVYIRSLYGKYLDTGGPTDNNTNIQTYHFDGTTSQQWTLELTSPYGRKDVADGIYTFHNYRNQNRVLDIMHDSKEVRANIQLYDDLDNSVQRFRVTKVLDDSNSFYYVIQSVHSGYWLDIASPFMTSGCNVQLWQDHTASLKISFCRAFRRSSRLEMCLRITLSFSACHGEKTPATAF